MPALRPQAAALLAGARRSDRPNAHLLPVPDARRRFDAEMAALGPGAPVHSVTERTLTTPAGRERLRIRVYRPLPGRLGVVVYLHGGGWLLGSLDSHDAVCRALANASGCVVVSVAYRRGPEHRFPAAVDDALAATRWIAAHGDAIGVDGNRLAVAGDSAGGNLAAAVTLLARDAGAPTIAFQVLAYPVTTADLAATFDDAYEGYLLFRDELRWHQDNYLATPADRRSPLVSPLDAADLRGLPPALVVVACCDPLHLQGERYAARLAAAGVPVELAAYEGQVHGFFQLPHVMDDGRDAVQRAGRSVRLALIDSAAREN